MSIFASTAAYYQRYRAGVPESLAAVVDAAAPREEPRRLLDVGTGTGAVLNALHTSFDEVVAIDPDPDLLAIASERARDWGREADFSFLEASAESFQLAPEWRAQAVTVCRAFHWFDRPVFLDHVRQFMAPSAVIAILDDRSIWAGGDEWKDQARGIIQDMFGTERRAGPGHFVAPIRSYREELHGAGFLDIRKEQCASYELRDIESVLGLLYSSSFASPHVLGARRAEFAGRMLEALAPLADEQGLFGDHNMFTLYTAKNAGEGVA